MSASRTRGGEQEFDNIPHYYLRYFSLSSYGQEHFNVNSAKAALKMQLSVALKGFCPDIIHAHTLGFDSELGVWLKEKLGIPLVVTTHGSDTSIPMELGKGVKMCAYCLQVDHIVAVSSVLGNRLRACGTTTPITSILNGYAAQSRRTEVTKKPLSFLQVGYLQEQKRPAITIRAFEKICKAHPEAHLTIIGQGPDREILEVLCKDLGIQKSVQFTGQLPNSAVLAEMAQSQFFIMPSVREGLGVVYLEAMASSCITIGTEGEGISDLIVPGENGFLVPPDDPDAIAQVIEWCLSHPNEATEIAQKGRLAAEELTWVKNAKQYLNLFQTLLERRSK